jgi:hypothetical protein
MTPAAKNKLNEITTRIEAGSFVTSFEFSINELTASEQEDLRYFLMNKGLKAEIYTELKQTRLGLWIK